MSVTLETIARELNLSRTTVSRALNNSNLVSEKTKKKVMETAQRLSYRPNSLARGLATRHSNLIGVVSSELGNAFYAKIVHGIESVLSTTEYDPIFFDSGGNPKREERHIDHLLSLRVDGIIITTTWPSVDVFSEVLKAGVPMVFVDNIIKNVPSHSVTIDNYLGARRITEYLIEINHKHICFFAGTDKVYVYNKRLEGYMDAMNEAGLSVHICQSGITMEDGYQTAKELLKSGRLPTAIVCLSDNTALGALHAIKEHGLSVPRDISLTGFNNLDFTKYIDPPLTTVVQPALQMGKTAAEIIVSCLRNNGDMSKRQNVVFTPEIIIRQSTRGIE